MNVGKNNLFDFLHRDDHLRIPALTRSSTLVFVLQPRQGRPSHPHVPKTVNIHDTMSSALDVVLLASSWSHVLLAPYTKVEESFNLHATHDVMMYGIGANALPKVRVLSLELS